MESGFGGLYLLLLNHVFKNISAFDAGGSLWMPPGICHDEEWRWELLSLW